MTEGFATLAGSPRLDVQQLLAHGPPKGGRRTRKNLKHGGEYKVDAESAMAAGLMGGGAPLVDVEGAMAAGLLGGGNSMVGSKAEVFHGKASRTSGGLTRKDLVLNKRGRIVSRKQQAAGKKAFSRLVKAGFKPRKGTFKLFRRKN